MKRLTSDGANLPALFTRPLPKFCTSADTAKIATLNSELDELENSDEFDPRQYLKFNQSFHFTLYALSQTEILLETIEILWLQSRPLLHLLTAGMALQHGHKRHSEIVACLAAGDGVGASEALRNDIREAYVTMFTTIWPDHTGDGEVASTRFRKSAKMMNGPMRSANSVAL